MKFKDGFVLREVCGRKIVSAEGIERLDFNKMLTLNASAALLWERFYGSEFTEEDMAAFLVETYQIPQEMALKDVKALCQSWQHVGVLA